MNDDPYPTVYIGFSDQAWNPLSWIVSIFTKSRASHVWLVTSLFDTKCVVEAGAFGFFPSRTLKRFRAKNRIVSLIPIQHDLTPGMRWAAESFGERYDYGGLFGMVVVVAGRFFHRRWRNPIGSRHALFCSEAVAEILKRSGYPGAEAFVPEETTPEQILKFLESGNVL